MNPLYYNQLDLADLQNQNTDKFSIQRFIKSNNNMNQQVTDTFLQAGDLITISFNNQTLSTEGFKSSQVRMLPETNLSRPFQTLFRIESDAYYDTPIYLFHLISGKYLCCGTRGIKLTANKKPSCQIIFKPIFRCQIAITRRVRINEEVMISLADIRTRQDNLAWVANPFRIKNFVGCQILIKRNEATNFQITIKSIRNKQSSNLSTCAIYQLINYETGRNLCANQNTEKVITFEKAINQHDMYIQVLKTGRSNNYINEEIINFDEDIYIRSYKTNKFLSINFAGKVSLHDQPNQNSVFSLQSYHDKRLKEDSFIKVLHKSTRKYISINPSAVIQEFKLLNIFQLKKVPEKKMRDTLFINQLCNSLKQVLVEEADVSSNLSKIRIKQLLWQIVKFIYGKIQLAVFLQMGGPKVNQNKENDQKANEQKKGIKKQNEVSSKDFLLSQKIRITRQEQDLLGNVGILQILLQILTKLLPSLSYSTDSSSNQQQNQKQSADENDILSCVMMATAGVCYNHASNTRIFIKGIQNYYEAIGLVEGAIECLYHIFRNNKQHLIILQGTQKTIRFEHSSKTQNISSLQMLLSFVIKIKMTPEMRAKIIRLLEIMCVSRITSGSHNIFRHQVSILKALSSKKLEGLILPMIPNEQNDLIVKTLTNHQEEFQQILMWKNKYEGEINLLEAQLNLLASLCFNQVGSNLLHVQKIISQDVIYRYLKGNLTPEFRQIFMRLLIEIYLKSDNPSRAIIICNSIAKNNKRSAQKNFDESNGISNRLMIDSSDPYEMEQITARRSSIHTKTIQNIQNLVLQVTRKAISNQIIDCSFYMNIKALRKFLELNILDKREIVQFKQILIDFVQRFSQYAFLQQEKKNLMIEILKIFRYYQELQKYRRAQAFITKVSFLKKPRPSEIEQQLTEFCVQDFDSSSFSQSQIKILKCLLQESLDYQQQDIFYHCSTLLKNIGIRQSQFVGELKEKIIINSKWTLQLYNKITKLILLVRAAVQEHKQIKGEFNQMALSSQQQKINQILNQINYFFYEWPLERDNNNVISPLTQNLFRQLQAHKIAILFLQENAGSSTNGSPTLITAMSTCIEFLLHFIENNDTNLLLMAQFFIQGNNVFQNAQCGQAKLIYQVLKMSKSKEIVWRRIYRCLMTYIRSSNVPNPYGILSLIRLFHQQVPQKGKNFGKINKENIQSFANVLINDQSFRLNFFKVKKVRIGKYDASNQYSFIFSTNNQDKLRYNSSWPLYLMQLSKLLLMLMEHSSQNGKIINLIKQCMPIEILIQDAFNCLDLIQNVSINQLSTTLMKRQLIKLFLRVHLESLKEIREVQIVLSFMQKNHQRILQTRNDSNAEAQSLVQDLKYGRLNDEGKVIVQTQFYNEKTKKSFMANFNSVYTSITIYYPFILRILHGLSTSNKVVNEKQQIRQQLELLQDIMFRKFKDLVLSKVTHSEFAPYFKDYLNAIQTCQQVFRRKIGFKLSYEDDQQEEQQFDSKSDQCLFVPSKIQNLIGNLKVCQSPQQQKQKIIYQCLVHIILSSKIRENIRKNIADVRFFNLEKERIAFAQKLTISLINKNPQHFGVLIDNLHFLCELSKSNVNQQILKMVILEVENEQQDLSNQKLAKFLEFSNQFSNSLLDLAIHTNDTLIQRMRTIPGRKSFNKLGVDLSKGFYPQKLMERIIKIVTKQKQVYSNFSLLSQLQCQMQGVRLSFQLYNSTATIQNCLLWIRNNLLMLTPQKKEILHNAVIEVVELLKVYGNFIQQFKGRYVSKQLKNKLQLCYSILFHAISGCNIKNTIFLIERQVWTEVNIILKLEDSYQKNIMQMESDNQELFRKLGSYGLKHKARNYIHELKTIYQNSGKFYSHYFCTDQQFPLLPAKAYYSTIKKWAIALLKQYKLLPPRIANQFLTRISISTIDKNIIDIFDKHQTLIGQFDIGATEVDFIYDKTDPRYQIAKNMDIQNAVDLCSIKMFIQNTSGEGQLQAEYRSFRINEMNHKKITSAASEIVSFIKDLCLVMISCLLPLFQKPKKKQKGDIQAIMRFFFTKIGRMEMIFDDSIFMSQFIIRPECRINKSMNKKFLNTINFVSIQLKNESIMKNVMYYILFYVNQINYFEKYNRWRIMRFLDRHVGSLKVISFALVVAQNVLLIVNSTTDQMYFTQLDFTSPFEIIQVLNMFISYTVLFKYFLKDVPLLVMKVDTQLAKRAQSYGSNYKSYSFATKAIIKGSKILADTGMIYNLTYTLIVSMCLKNKLFASLVLLDVFFQVPTLTNLLDAIWRPKVQLLLAIISFTLIQYFFSIFMFFNFRTQTLGFCDTLGGCFGFVFVTTYKAVGGFVGFLFQQQQKAGQINTTVNFFQIFQNIYVILIFQIFFALILSIIIDNFTQIRSNHTERKANLESQCIVCNLDRSLFNVSTKINFKGHIAINHSIWNYFYFYQYILKKDPLFRNHFEREIYEKRNLNFLPNNYAKGIKQPQKDISSYIDKILGS